MRHDYDPMFDEPEDHGFDAILAEVKGRSTGHWGWEKAHLVFTGKDADLEPWGYQALELTEVTEDTVRFTLHCMSTIVGEDVCLNLPEDIAEDDEKWGAVREIYLDQAQAVVQGTGVGGYWDGDDWVLTLEQQLEVLLMLDEDGQVLVVAIVDAMEEAAQPVIEKWEEEMGYMHKLLDNIAGWCDMEGNHIPEGTVIEGSACWLWQQQEN